MGCDWNLPDTDVRITFWGNGRFVTDYQVHRLEALITGEHWDYTRGAVADVAMPQKIPIQVNGMSRSLPGK